MDKNRLNPFGETIQEHFHHPRNYGFLDQPGIRQEDVNPFCGDRIRIDLALSDDGIVRAARFEGDLCMIGKAAASLLMERIEGTPLEASMEITEQEVFEALRAEIRPARRPCALLPLNTLLKAARAWRENERT